MSRIALVLAFSFTSVASAEDWVAIDTWTVMPLASFSPTPLLPEYEFVSKSVPEDLQYWNEVVPSEVQKNPMQKGAKVESVSYVSTPRSRRLGYRFRTVVRRGLFRRGSQMKVAPARRAHQMKVPLVEKKRTVASCSS